MTEEEFKKIIKPIGLMADTKNIPFMETLLLANYNKWTREQKALSLSSVRHLACDRCKRSLSANIKEGECIICNTKL